MADPNNPRSHRPYDPQQRAGGADDEQRGSGDPLAELARLIGQNDPFAEYERNRAAGEAQRGPRMPTAAKDWPAEPAPAQQAATQESYSAAPAPDAYAAAATPQQPEQYPPGTYPQYSAEAQGYAVDAHGYPLLDAQGYPIDPHGHPADPQGYPADAYQGYDPYYSSEGQPLDEAEYHEQEERKRRRRRLVTVIAILALAVFGGAGAYGYRTMFGSPVRSSPPPVIKADTTPTKVMPAIQAGDSASNKLIYDRVGEGNQAERVVPREEKPIDIKTATVAAPPRVVYPGPETNAVASPPPATFPVAGQNTGGQVLPIAAEPSVATPGSGAILPSAKKVRTVTIRPDMTVVPSPSTPARAAPEPAPRAAPLPVRPVPPPAPSTRSVAPAPAPNVAPPPRQSAAAPLSLSPSAAAQPDPAPPPRAPARATPPAQPLALAAPTPAAAPNEPRTAATGSYLVQVSSQRSEAEANASYRTLQARYPNVLAGRSSSVRRADLGSKGVYYRAMVGPFPTAEQAGQFCSSLKAAGGQCIIHRN